MYSIAEHECTSSSLVTLFCEASIKNWLQKDEIEVLYAVKDIVLKVIKVKV
jgi:hypothetical protein